MIIGHVKSSCLQTVNMISAVDSKKYLNLRGFRDEPPNNQIKECFYSHFSGWAREPGLGHTHTCRMLMNIIQVFGLRAELTSLSFPHPDGSATFKIINDLLYVNYCVLLINCWRF